MPPFPPSPTLLSVHNGRVLSLYREIMRIVNEKPQEQREVLAAHVRNEFRRRMLIPKREISTIEFYVRRAQRQLDVLRSEGIRSVSLFRPDTTEAEEGDGSTS